MLHQKLKGPVAGRAIEPNGFGEQLDGFSNTAERTREQEQAANDLARVRAHLEKRAEANRIIASWRDYLRQKIERVNLAAELCGSSAEEIDDLRSEVDRFKRVCHALSWDPAGRRRS